LHELDDKLLNIDEVTKAPLYQRGVWGDSIERQNILNNNYALEEIQKAAEIKGVIFQDQIYLTKDQIARFFEVDVRTIERYISDYSDELRRNGYEIIKGEKLKQFKINIAAQGVSDINVGDKTNSVSIFNFAK
jgi:hypothetical protein